MDRFKSSLTKSINVVKEKAAASIDSLQQHHSSSKNTFPSPVQQQQKQQQYQQEEEGEVLKWVHHEFFLACQKNDCLRAYELYTMPYQDCVNTMLQQQQHQEQQQKQDVIDKLLLRKKDLLSSKGWFKANNNNDTTVSTASNYSTSDTNPTSVNYSSSTATSGVVHNAKDTLSTTINTASETLGFLEESKHPCEFFPTSYFSTLLQQQSPLVTPSVLAQKFKEKLSKKGFTTSQKQQPSPVSSSTAATTTTPLHEVARLGYPPLLRRMLLLQRHHFIDLSIQDWKQRTILHYVCGGSNKINNNNNQEEEEEEEEGNCLKSFYQCTIDQKKRKEQEKKEKFTQMFRNNWTKQLLLETKSELARLLPTPTNTSTATNTTTASDTAICKTTISSSSNAPTVNERSVEEDIANRLECLLIIFSILEAPHHHHPVRINTVDCRVRTALHYASSLNRYSLVRALLSQPNILVSIVDEGGRTACDLSSSEDVQSILEAKALFSSEEEEMQQQQQQQRQQKPWFETWDISRIDLERQSIIENAQKQIQQQFSSSSFSVSITTNYAHCAALLEKYNWNVESFVSALSNNNNLLNKEKEVEEEEEYQDKINRTCLICYSTDVREEEWTYLKDCPHGFCTSCLQEYITTNFINPTTRTSSTPTLRIPCPQYDCQNYISEAQLSTLVSSQDIRTLQQGENELFILSYRPQRFKFCPHVGCSGIVHASPPLEYEILYGEDCWKYMGAVCTAAAPSCTTTTTKEEQSTLSTGSGGSSKDVHRFCFSCSSLAPHWPASCEYYAQWVATVEEEMKGISSNNNFDDVAHHLWLKANTRPCPKCNTPIEKNDGCNHMICLNRHCRYEFCWICRKDWSLHSTRTGGYFLCNRWAEDDEPAVNDFVRIPSTTTTAEIDATAASNLQPLLAQETLPMIDNILITDPQPPLILNSHTYGTSMYTARTAREQAKRMARFIFYYGRWTAQQESSQLETKIASTLDRRLQKMLSVALKESEYISLDVPTEVCSFVRDAFQELRECRSILQHSYAYAFCRFAPQSDTPRDIEKLMFEHWQSELEMITEQLSNAVARSHLRASRSQIIQLSQAAAQRRNEFSIHVISVRHEEALEGTRQHEIHQSTNNDTVASQQQEPTAAVRDEDATASRYAGLQQQYIVGSDELSSRGIADILERMLQLERTDAVTNSGSHDDDSSFGLLVENEYFDVYAPAEEEVQLQRALEASMGGMMEEGSVTTWACANCTYLNTTTSRTMEPTCALCNSRQS